MLVKNVDRESDEGEMISKQVPRDSKHPFLYRVISLWTCGTVNEILVDNVLHFQKCLLEKVR